MDNDEALHHAVAIAQAFIEGTLTPLQTGREIVRYVDPWRPLWGALGGADGPLSAFYVAEEYADRMHFLGADVERWHPNVSEQKRIELAEAEAKMAPSVLEACRTLIAYARS
jgi:hypothetical protein